MNSRLGGVGGGLEQEVVRFLVKIKCYFENKNINLKVLYMIGFVRHLLCSL